MTAAADSSRAVSAMSSGLAVGSPDGWLCTTSRETVPALRTRGRTHPDGRPSCLSAFLGRRCVREETVLRGEAGNGEYLHELTRRQRSNDCPAPCGVQKSV